MPQGLSAGPQTAYPARPGRGQHNGDRPRASTPPSARPRKRPGPARPRQPARYGAARAAAARRPAGGSRTRAAAQPAPPRTRRPPPAGSSATTQNWPFCASRDSADLPPRHAVCGARRGGTPGIELRSVIRTGRHSVASNRLVTNPSSLRIVLPAPISHSGCRAVVVAAVAQAADPGAPAVMPSLARVSSANRPAPWSPAFTAVTAAGPGPRGMDAGSGCCPAEVACGVWFASSVWRLAGHVRSCWHVALRWAGSMAAAKPGICRPPQRSVSIGAGAARRIG